MGVSSAPHSYWHACMCAMPLAHTNLCMCHNVLSLIYPQVWLIEVHFQCPSPLSPAHFLQLTAVFSLRSLSWPPIYHLLFSSMILVSVAWGRTWLRVSSGFGRRVLSGRGAGSVVLNASSMLPAEVSRKEPMVLEAEQSPSKHSLELAVISSNPTPFQRATAFPPD